MAPGDRNYLLDSVWSWEETETDNILGQTPTLILIVKFQRGNRKQGWLWLLRPKVDTVLVSV